MGLAPGGEGKVCSWTELGLVLLCLRESPASKRVEAAQGRRAATFSPRLRVGLPNTGCCSEHVGLPRPRDKGC